MAVDADRVQAHGRPATVDDVARAAQVSRQTVSRVMNGSGRVAASTRLRVQDAVRVLGYVPDPAAQRMGRTRAARSSCGTGPTEPLDLPQRCLEAIEVLRAAGLVVRVLDEATVEVDAPGVGTG